MDKLRVFRHEYKYAIPYEEALSLRHKLNELLSIDRDSNGYMVRSLYFDTLNDDDYYDKLGGEYKRKKIRLRIYDVNDEAVKLELKAKEDYHQLKESLIIKRNDAIELMRENYTVLLNYDDSLAQKLYYLLNTGYYKPKIIIEYQRIAYMSKNNTRITFDFNIRESNDINKFFQKDINYYDLTDGKDIILEVKFDRFLEPYLTNILSKYITRYQSFSKYVIGRNI